MRTKIFIFLICNLLIWLPLGNLLISQSINLTLGSGGIFTLKDASANYFTLSQSTGQVNILKSLRLENTANATTGVIFFGADRFLHNYGSTAFAGNTFMGWNSGNFIMTGNYNTGLGEFALYSNTTGSQNTSVGESSLFSNTTGSYNTSVGMNSLLYNTTGSFNTALGQFSLFDNTTGNYNTALGFSSLNFNSTGSWNTALGGYPLYSNTTGSYNTALGFCSLINNTTGFRNSSLGDSAGLNITTGSNNIAIGWQSQVPNGTLSNQVRIGNTSITYAGIQVSWTITSDRRWKSDIQNSGLGLGFISKLRPVSYFRNNDESKKTEYGFIAQEVEDVLKETGTENTGMITVTDEGMYELRYNDLLAPMVKAIQELNEKCAALESENSQLKSEIESLKDMKVKLTELEQSQLELTKLIKSENSKKTQSVNISDNK